MCESKLGVIVFPVADQIERMKEILQPISDASGMQTLIAASARSMNITRFFWKEILGEEFDWEFSTNPNCMKKFFRQFSLMSYYQRKQDRHFAHILMAYENLTYCTSAEVLRQM